MTEEIINSDGSRNWQANILLDNIKRLEQEKFALTQESQQKSQTICELAQENKDFETLAKSLYKRIEKLEKENEALAFRERLYKADYEASEQENKELKEANQSLSILGTDLASAHETVRKEFFRAYKNKDMWREKAEKYRSALEEISGLAPPHCTQCSQIINIINEVLK